MRVVVSDVPIPIKKDGLTRWFVLVKCDCGTRGLVMRGRLPKTRSCGCARPAPDPTSIRQRALALGLKPNTVYTRALRGWTIRGALSKKLGRREGTAEKAREAGLKPSTVRTRIARGWPKEFWFAPIIRRDDG